jgi:uncharacterized membrane protein
MSAPLPPRQGDAARTQGPMVPAGRDPRPPLSPAQFRLLVSRVLAIGVGVSAALIAAGFVAALVLGWQTSLVGAPASSVQATDFGAVWAGLAAVRPIAFVQLGLLVLLATPVLRVATTFLAFLVEGDRTFAALTAVVLAILLAGLVVIR